VSLPAWFDVTRSFEFAAEFRVHTEIARETPLGAPALVHLPLLASEAVHDARIQVKDGSALIAFGPDDAHMAFDSTLSQVGKLELVAGAFESYSQRRQLSCGSMWQCDATGLVPVSLEDHGQWQPSYRPWPGERLKIALKKPRSGARSVDDDRCGQADRTARRARYGCDAPAVFAHEPRRRSQAVVA
jgi:hypothetical protein